MLRTMSFILLAFPLLDIGTTYLAVQWLGGLVWLWLLAAIPLGMLLIRRHARNLLPTLLASLQQGEAPLAALLGGLRVGIAGLLLMLPGLLSDVLALLALVPIWPKLPPAKSEEYPETYEGEFSRVTTKHIKLPEA